mmetsp:Transcript_8715/g.19770  ORF Transcript_8715/g.19770 Transcript_8715/m.19770 type:complete len:90 (+) Transcript_8715:2215-2484(+)
MKDFSDVTVDKLQFDEHPPRGTGFEQLPRIGVQVPEDTLLMPPTTTPTDVEEDTGSSFTHTSIVNWYAVVGSDDITAPDSVVKSLVRLD